jgi:hypothetical protein
VANEVVGLDVVARLDGFREELAKIPDIGAREAKQLATQLSRELKMAERAAKQAAKASKDQQRAAKAGTRAVEQQTAAMKRLTAAVSLGPIIEGAKKLADAFGKGVERATELDTAAGGSLAASLAELRGEAGGLADAFLIELTPSLESAVNWMAYVANGAALAARSLFGLTTEQARARAATEAGNAAVEKQADRVGNLQKDIEAYTASLREAGWADPSSNQGLRNMNAQLEAQRTVLRKLKGELKFGEGTPVAAAVAPAAKTSKAATRRSGPDPAKEAERQAAAVVAAYESIREASRTLAADRAGDEAKVRLESDRALEAIQANLAKVVDSQAATEDQRTAAIVAARSAEVDLEAVTAARITEIRKRAAREEQAMIQQTASVREMSAQDSYGLASSLAGSLVSLAGAVGEADVAAAQGSSEARQRAAKRAWAATTALSIAQAAVNIPLAISQGLAAPWPASIGAAAAGGVAAGAALAGVIAKAAAGPKFHSGTGSAAQAGGLAPDEFSAVLRKREAVVTEAGVGRLGGPDAIRRANRGESPQGGPTQLVFRVANRTTDVQTLEALRRPDSPMAAAIAEGRAARVGSARIW